MKSLRIGIIGVVACFGLSGCAALGHLWCEPNCRSVSHNSSSLVSFLYPDGETPPREDTIPELHVPLRVGLAFLPSEGRGGLAITAAQREELMNRIRRRFADRKFIAEITEVPDYYLSTNSGFQGLEGVQRLYQLDLMALVSYDQVAHLDDNDWSLGYLTIVGAYVLKGSRHDVTTLVDLAVIDPATHSLVIRAGGTDTRHGNTTLIDQQRETRATSGESFAAATDRMIENFDIALKKFESDVHDGKARVRVVQRSGGTDSRGGGAIGEFFLEGLLALMGALRWRKAKGAIAS